MITTVEPQFGGVVAATTTPPQPRPATTTERTPGPIDNMREQIKEEMRAESISPLKTSQVSEG